jgi:hypothetical protein
MVTPSATLWAMVPRRRASLMMERNEAITLRAMGRDKSRTEGIDLRCGQGRELCGPDPRHNVLGHMRAIMVERRPFELFQLGSFQPVLGRPRHGQAAALGRVDALGDVDRHLGMVGDSVVLARERLDVPLALAVDIIDDPGLLGLALLRGPRPFAHRHDSRPRPGSFLDSAGAVILCNLSGYTLQGRPK